MELDDEGPPSLVGASDVGQEDSNPLGGQLDNLSLVKVPITIVTGMRLCFLDFELVLLITTRLFRRRQDDVTQLHFAGAAWEEDCCHTQWLVHILLSIWI